MNKLAKTKIVLRIFLVLVILTTSSYIILATSLQAKYTFNDGDANDSSDNSNDGTITGANCSVTGKYGTGCYFDGDDDNINCWNDTTLRLNGGRTIAAWIKGENISKGLQGIVAKWGDTTGVNKDWYLGLNDNFTRGTIWEIDGIAGFKLTYENVKLENDIWYHVAMTYDSTPNSNNISVYVNGNITDNIVVNAAPFNSSSSDSNVLIGDLAGFNFQGIIDEVYIYNSTLNPTEINTLKDTNSSMLSTNCSYVTNTVISGEEFWCDEFVVSNSATVTLQHSTLHTNWTIYSAGSTFIQLNSTIEG